MSGDFRIVRLRDQPDREDLIGPLEAIFFEASGTKTFADAGARAAFRQRWLGLYLDAWPEHVHMARDAEGNIGGYLTGSLVNPAADARFAAIGYFRTFAEACARFPAHLHINLAPAARGRGIGGRLIDAFATDAARAGAPGLHVVTGKHARNIGFYRQQGFGVIAETANPPVVFLGRDLP